MAISFEAEAETIAREDMRIKRFKNLPLSAKFVFKILEYNGLFTQKEIAEESGLPNRTVRYALNIFLIYSDFTEAKRTSQKINGYILNMLLQPC